MVHITPIKSRPWNKYTITKFQRKFYGEQLLFEKFFSGPPSSRSNYKEKVLIWVSCVVLNIRTKLTRKYIILKEISRGIVSIWRILSSQNYKRTNIKGDVRMCRWCTSACRSNIGDDIYTGLPNKLSLIFQLEEVTREKCSYHRVQGLVSAVPFHNAPGIVAGVKLSGSKNIFLNFYTNCKPRAVINHFNVLENR